MNMLPAISVFLPFFFAAFILVFYRHNEIMIKVFSLVGSGLSFLVCAAMISPLLRGETLSTGTPYFAFPLSISFQADGLSIFFATIFSFCFFLAFVYSLGYLNHGHAKLRYFVLLLVVQGSIIGVVMAASLFGLFLFFEVMAISSYMLVIHEEDSKAMYAGSKYLFMTIVAGLAIFFGLGVTYYLGGSLNYLPGGYIGASAFSGYALLAFLLGFGLKAGLFPVHIWLPDAHPAAPAAVSALLSGCMIKTGAYGFIRVMHFVYTPEAIKAIHYDKILLWLAVITILLGSAMALQQDHLKRRLAYSSVAQIGYVLLGIALFTQQAMFGALFHIFSHAFMKGTLFLCAGAIVTQTEKKYVSEMRGIGYKMPVTMLAFTLASVTMVGIPPFNAFISKWHLAMASLDTGQGILVAVLIVSSLLNALYYFPIVVNAFFSGKEDWQKNPTTWILDEIPRSMVWSTALMAVLCVAFAFVQPHWPVVLAETISSAIFKF
jgi:multicomponent Na+:H+ antiporter subunit D